MDKTFRFLWIALCMAAGGALFLKFHPIDLCHEPSSPAPIDLTTALEAEAFTLAHLLDTIEEVGDANGTRTEYQKAALLQGLQGKAITGRAYVDQVFKSGDIMLRPFEEPRYLKDYAYAAIELSPEVLLTLNQGTPVEIKCALSDYAMNSAWLKCSRVEIVQ